MPHDQYHTGDIKGILSKLRRQRTRIKAQLTSLSEESQTKKQIETSFSELLHYFPNADTKTLGDVESFHAGLSAALAFEFKEKKKELEELLSITEEEIGKQENELRSVSTIVLEKLFEMYSKTEKQVFIAMDKEMSYTERAQEILNDSVVLRLSPDGNELFGRSWNKKTKEDK